MKYCFPYYNKFRYTKSIDQIVLLYNRYNDNIVQFVKEQYTPEQTIIVDITQDLNELDNILPVLKMLQMEHENILIRTYSNCYTKLREAGLPYFFLDLCYTLDSVYSFIKQGVTDVYIVGELGFSLNEVSQYCHRKGVKIRVYPQMAQSLSGEGTDVPALCKFFIRPEDTPLYESMIDVFEFFSQDPSKYSVWFQIYKNQNWPGDLGFLISGLEEEDIPNNGIPAYFGLSRINCHHRCMIEKCNICQLSLDISKILDNNSLQVERKNKEWANVEN